MDATEANEEELMSLEEAKAIAAKYNAARKESDPHAYPRMSHGVEIGWYVEYRKPEPLPDHP